MVFESTISGVRRPAGPATARRPGAVRHRPRMPGGRPVARATAFLASAGRAHRGLALAAGSSAALLGRTREQRMPARRRRIMSVIAAMSVVLGLSLSMTGPAQAAGGGPAARSATGHAATHQHHAKPDPKVDQTQKAVEAHYTNAPCNRAQNDYLEK